MTTCDQLELLAVSDEAEERARAEAHARGCPRCAAVLRGQARLLEEVRAWKAATAPPPDLERRVLAALSVAAAASEAEPAAGSGIGAGARRSEAPEAPGRVLRIDRPERHRRRERPSGRRRLAAWSVLAAALLVAALGLWRLTPGPQAPQEARHLLVAEAVAEAEAAEREHARAIARLEQAAAPRLARADDPETGAGQAALLLSYRDRLAFLDSTIAEVRSFLEDNPGNPAGRTVLLAAYKEKTQVLREVLALEERS